MEQRSQEKTRQTEQTRETERQTSRIPERERLSGAGYVIRAVAEGASLLDMPPARLEELAGWLGNQNMAALLEAQGGLWRKPGLYSRRQRRKRRLFPFRRQSL